MKPSNWRLVTGKVCVDLCTFVSTSRVELELRQESIAQIRRHVSCFSATDTSASTKKPQPSVILEKSSGARRIE